MFTVTQMYRGTVQISASLKPCLVLFVKRVYFLEQLIPPGFPFQKKAHFHRTILPQRKLVQKNNLSNFYTRQFDLILGDVYCQFNETRGKIRERTYERD